MPSVLADRFRRLLRSLLSVNWGTIIGVALLAGFVVWFVWGLLFGEAEVSGLDSRGFVGP